MQNKCIKKTIMYSAYNGHWFLFKAINIKRQLEKYISKYKYILMYN